MSTTTQRQLRQLDPAALLAAGLRAPLAGKLRELGPPAFVEQVRMDALPLDALELWLVLLHRVQAQGVTDERLRWLRERLALQASGYDRFAAWAAALGEAVVDAASLAGAIELLAETRQLWALSDGLRSVSPSGDA